MADRREQCGAQPVGFFQRADDLGSGAQLALLERRLDLRDEGVEDAPVRSLQVTPGEHHGAVFAELDDGALLVPGGGHRTGDEQPLAAIVHNDAGQAEDLTKTIREGLDRVLPADDAAGDCREGLGLGGGSLRRPAATGIRTSPITRA